MADNVLVPFTGAGQDSATVATDNIGGIQFQRIKVSWGIAGAAVDTSNTNPFPVRIIAANTITVNNTTLSVVGGGAEATALRVTIANDTTGILSVAQSGTWNINSITSNVTIQGSITTASDAVATASNTGGQATVTITSGTILAANASRKGAKIYAHPFNTNTVYIKLGATATSANFPLLAGDSIDLNFGNAIYTGIVDAIAASGTQQINVMEV